MALQELNYESGPNAFSKEPDGHLSNERRVFGLNIPGDSPNPEALVFFEVTFSKNPSVCTRLRPHRSAWTLFKSARVVPPPGAFSVFFCNSPAQNACRVLFVSLLEFVHHLCGGFGPRKSQPEPNIGKPNRNFFGSRL